MNKTKPKYKVLKCYAVLEDGNSIAYYTNKKSAEVAVKALTHAITKELQIPI